MLTPDERDRLERGLQDERARTMDAIRDFERARETSMLEGTGELTMYRLHPADIGTEAMEQEKQFLLASQEGRKLYDIDDALRRLYSEPRSFGICLECGGQIGFERLSFLPYASLCAECQISAER